MKRKWQNLLNYFFSIIVKNLEIPEYPCEDTLHIRLSSHSALQATMKLRDHPSINIIRCFSKWF